MPPFTLATFNVRYGTAPDGPDHWDHRWSVFGDTVVSLGADILCLQEALLFQLDHARHVLPGYEAAGVGRDDGRQGGEMVPVLWKSDRFERVEAGHFWLTPEPHIPGVRGWDAKSIRMCTWVTLRSHDFPRPLLTVFNTHLDYQGEAARLEGARLLRRRVTALGPGMPVVVAGDFNCTEADPPFAALVADRHEPGDGLRDAYREVHPHRDFGTDGTRHDFDGRKDGPRIDWILVSPHFRVADCRIDHTSRDGSFPSDHFPVVAGLELSTG